MLMAVRVTDYGGRWCDGRVVAPVGRGLFAAAVSNEKTASEEGDRLSLEFKRIFSAKMLRSIASAFPIFFAGLLAMSIIPLMPVAFSSIAFVTAGVVAIVLLTVAAVLPETPIIPMFTTLPIGTLNVRGRRIVHDNRGDLGGSCNLLARERGKRQCEANCCHC